MNYIELINNFWQADKEHSFTGNETKLYFYLVHTCNSLGWKNPFRHSNGYITASLNISEKTLIGVRNNLKQAGLIDFHSDKGRRNTVEYEINTGKITAFRAETGKLFGQKQVSFSGANPSDNIKLNKTKLNNTPPPACAEENFPEARPPAEPASPEQPKKEEKEKSCGQKEKEPEPDPFASSKIKFAEDVRMTSAEHQALIRTHGEEKTKWMIEKLNASKLSRGATYPSDYWAICNWVTDRANKEFKPKNSHASNKQNSTRQPSGETAEQAAGRYTQYNPNKLRPTG